MSAAQFATLWVLNNRFITSVIGGPRTREQWRDYLGATDPCLRAGGRGADRRPGGGRPPLDARLQRPAISCRRPAGLDCRTGAGGSAMTTDNLAFTGLRVCDLTQGVAGPHCAFLLAQHGADVIKIEPPGGDWARGIGKRHGPYSAFFLQVNRGKRSLALDLKQAEARDAAAKIAAGADIVLEAFRPGVTARFGLDYESVRAVNPDVIYLSVTGYGQTGPWSDRPLTDSIAQAVTGMMAHEPRQGRPAAARRHDRHRRDDRPLRLPGGLGGALRPRRPGRAGPLYRHESARSRRRLHGRKDDRIPPRRPGAAGRGRSRRHVRERRRLRDRQCAARQAFRGALRPGGPAGAGPGPALRRLRGAGGKRGRIDGAARPLVRERSTAEWVRLLGEATSSPGRSTISALFPGAAGAPQQLRRWQEHDAVGRVPMHAVPGIETAPEGGFLATAPTWEPTAAPCSANTATPRRISTSWRPPARRSTARAWTRTTRGRKRPRTRKRGFCVTLGDTSLYSSLCATD